MATRSDFIGGTDAGRIVNGDWLSLYEEKLGLREPENLQANFPVQLGIHTERFHIDWLNKFHGFEIGKPLRFVSRKHPPLVAHIDGWCQVRNTFVDTKHSNGRATMESMVQWYLPQMAHYCLVIEKPAGWLSYIAGNASPEFFKIEPSPSYLAQLLDLELAFWWHVVNRQPPEELPGKKLAEAREEAAAVLIDDMRSVSMEGNNAWGSLALDYLDGEAPARKFEAAKKGLKDMIDADVRQAKGYGIIIKRSKSGSLLFSKE